ncbi:MAG TPA: hypothetical protein VNA20_12470 [Frankiaceae bacterium]|nr:hypothetical protein [Frankiaceae bacterium]
MSLRRTALLAAAGVVLATPAGATSCRVDYAAQVATPVGHVTVTGYWDEGVTAGERGRTRVDVAVLGLPPYELETYDESGGPGPVEREVGLRRRLCR